MSRLACLALLLALCAPSLFAAEQEWHEVRSPNFAVLTDAGQDKGRQVALRFEQMRHVFGALLLKDKVNIPVPLLIIAFRNGKELRQHLPLWKGKPIAAAGLFVSSNDREFILLDLSNPRSYEVVFHEYAHLLLNGNFPRTQPWFDEGFAEYYSTIKVGKKDFEFGTVPEYVPYVLNQRGFIPIAELFSVSQESATYNESGDRRSAFYAQSLVVVHYIFDKKKLAETIQYFKLALNEKIPVAEAIRRAFKMEPKQLDRELNGYYHSNAAMSYELPMPIGLDNTGTYSYAARKVAPLDAQTEIADLHLHLRDYMDQGIGELENILQQDPNNGRAHRSLGYAYLYTQRPQKAAEHFKQAAQLEPNDPRVHYYAAALINAGGVMGGDFSSGIMREHLLKAVDLDPSYADAWSLLGFVYQVDQRYPQAIDALSRALKLSPRNDQYRLNLVRVYIEAKRFDDAQGLLTYLQGSTDASVTAQVEPLVAQLNERKEAPARTGRFEERPRPSTYDDPRWRKPEEKPGANDATRDSDDGADDAPEIKIDARPIVFIKGKLTAVSCQPSGAATLTVASGKKTLQLTTPNYKKLVVIGADQLSCSWSNRPVAVNYRESAPGTGDLVSLELQ
jgi:Flp pilus assembly protein TadD